AFQQKNGLTADGLAGTNTYRVLYSDSAVPAVVTATPSPSPTPDPSSFTTLRKGSTGKAVQQLQNALVDLGYTVNTNGTYTSETATAVKAFQKANGLSVDGLAGSATYAKLYSGSAVSAGGSSSSSSGSSSNSSSSSSSGSSWVIPKRTLRRNYTGDDVLSVQKRLKELGYYTGILDGHYGSGTIAAVKAFQEKHGLEADGLAGTQTFTILFSNNAQSAGSSSGSSGGSSSGSSGGSSSDSNEPAANQPTATAPSGGWTKLKRNDTGSSVKQLQEALAMLGYPVGVSSEDPVTYDWATVWAVECFQRRNGLSDDGVAGSATLSKLYGGKAVGADTTLSSNIARGKAPGGADLELLHWFDNIKSYLKNNRTFTVYDPATGLTWKMRLYSAGNHADSEPLTKEDADTMYKAWGNQWTWNEKPVYVQLANGTWCIASMPNMPHLSGSISDNGFEGHTCVHFPRTMTEVQKNDPKNAGRHNRDIRLKWRELNGEDIPW
ncbi:MAG: peptidoglycan-binding protein, partial [Clostridia bacterium]|nr:peptidoglycan-binding protein [Clostridia bacterium]